MSEAKDTPTRDEVEWDDAPTLSDDELLAKLNGFDNYDAEFKKRFRALSAALERAERERDVLVAAAYEAAAKACERAAYGWEFAQDDKVELGCLRSRDYIRALAKPEEHDALAERDARIRAEERERVLSFYRKLSRGNPVGASEGNTFTVRHVTLEELAAAIRGDDT